MSDRFNMEIEPAVLRKGLDLLLAKNNSSQILAQYPDIMDDDYSVRDMPRALRHTVIKTLKQDDPTFVLPPGYDESEKRKEEYLAARREQYRVGNPSNNVVNGLDLEPGVQRPRVAITPFAIVENVEAEVRAAHETQRTSIYQSYMRQVHRHHRRARRHELWINFRDFCRAFWPFALIITVVVMLIVILLITTNVNHGKDSNPINDNDNDDSKPNNSDPFDGFKIRGRAAEVNTVLKVQSQEIHYGIQRAGQLMEAGRLEELDDYLKAILTSQDGHMATLKHIEGKMDEEGFV